MTGSLWARMALLIVAVALAQPAPAQSYPAQPIKLVVPFAPGGATDILARTIGQRLAERIGQPVIIENKPGAGTTIVAEKTKWDAVVKASGARID